MFCTISGVIDHVTRDFGNKPELVIKVAVFCPIRRMENCPPEVLGYPGFFGPRRGKIDTADDPESRFRKRHLRAFSGG